MTLAPGSRLGPYEIVAPLGAGGMGEVWRARDPRLGREVAIKVVPAAFTNDADRMARFEREARALAALNHPGIAAIYGFEEIDGTRAIVQELVPGATLAERLSAGALPVDEAIAVARSIAEALEAAHERGIVHRDLKPGNVKITPDGAVKVLDFGLARAFDAAADSSSGLTHSPTLSMRMTEAGMILGTAAYMSPEQAKGKAADRRADIWSFGVVLFEMLAGRQLFEGETASETMAAVMKDEVRWNLLPAATPPAVRMLLGRCLTRDPRARLQSIGEARIVLENPGAMRAAEPTAAVRSGPNRVALAALLLGLALVAGGIGAWLELRSRPPKLVRKYPVSLADRRQEVADAILSPDGRWVAFFVEDSLWVRDLQSLRTSAVARGRSSMRPVWSPDSRQVGFSDGLRMWRMTAEDGAVMPIGAIPGGTRGTGASWREDGRIFLAFGAGGLFELVIRTGSVREVLPIDSTSSDFHEPLVLPGGGVAFIRHRRESGLPDRIAVWNGRDWHDLYSSEDYLSHMCWSPSGHLVFQQMGAAPGVWALPVSPRTLRATGEAFLIASGGAYPSVSQAGTLIYAEGLSAPRAIPSWWDSTHGLTRILGEDMGLVQNVSLSPDERLAAFNTPNERGFLNVWVLDVRTGARTRKTFANENQFNPVWSPDGREILFGTATSSYAFTVSGGEDATRIVSGNYPALAPDGRHLCVSRDGSNGRDLHVIERGVDTVGVPLANGRGDQIRAEIRPDGRLVAYMSEETGRFEIFLSRFPSGQGRWQVSTIGARRQRWSRDGRRLYFQSGDGGQLWVCEIGDSDNPTPGTPRRVVDMTRFGIQTWQGRNFDIAAGDRLLMFSAPTSTNGPGDVVMVENWFEEFRK